MPKGSDDAITRDVLIGLLDVVADALASTVPLSERTDLAESVTDLRTRAERIDRPRGQTKTEEGN